MSKPKKKMGRPKLPKGEQKIGFTIRLTAAEIAQIQKQAATKGVTASEFARTTLTAASIRTE